MKGTLRKKLVKANGFQITLKKDLSITEAKAELANDLVSY